MRSPEAAATIALVGLRGAGKSTLGRLLAAAIDRPFVDLDAALLELARERKVAGSAGSAGELLGLLGPTRFRELEQAALERVLARAPFCVLATGGGAVELESNRRLLREACFTVWLRASPQVLAERVEADPSPRPALVAGGDLAEARQLLARRAAWYREVSQLELDCGALTPAGGLLRLLEALEGRV